MQIWDKNIATLFKFLLLKFTSGSCKKSVLCEGLLTHYLSGNLKKLLHYSKVWTIHECDIQGFTVIASS